MFFSVWGSENRKHRTGCCSSVRGWTLRLYSFSQRLLYLCLLFWTGSSVAFLCECVCVCVSTVCVRCCLWLASWLESSNENNMLTKGWPQRPKMTMATFFLYLLFSEWDSHHRSLNRVKNKPLAGNTTMAGKIHAEVCTCACLCSACIATPSPPPPPLNLHSVSILLKRSLRLMDSQRLRAS